VFDGGVWLEHTAVIRRAPDDVFAFMDDSEAQARVTPGVHEVRDVQRLSNGGMACRLVYQILGFELSEHITAAAYEPPHYVEYEVVGPIAARLFGHYHPHEDGTYVRLAAYYELPSMFANALLSGLAGRANAWALKTMVERMTRELEASDHRSPKESADGSAVFDCSNAASRVHPADHIGE